MMSIAGLAQLRRRTTGRASSWDTGGGNHDAWLIPPGESVVLADIQGPAMITHIWLTQKNHYRECLLKITFDDAPHPGVLCPLGDFFCLGHGLVNSFQSYLFTASTDHPYAFNQGAALNCYAPMPFARRALVELVNESDEPHRQYFYIDYETLEAPPADTGYFHAEFRRVNPFGGWAPEVSNQGVDEVVNQGRRAWEDNYVILDTRGRGHYIGCNLSVTNFAGTWWGEGDDMIWVDGYKWPPDLHGTGSEDYLNQAWGMQDNAFLRHGSSIFEGRTVPPGSHYLYHDTERRGYQTSYVFHLENPVRFNREIRVTIEHGHANHLRNEMSSVAYWYAEKPARVVEPPPLAQRLPVLRDSQGNWLLDETRRLPGRDIRMSDEMKSLKAAWAGRPDRS